MRRVRRATRAKYAAYWTAFGLWCQARGHAASPARPGTVAVYLSALADRHLAPSTVGRILAAIRHHHRLAGLVAAHKAEGSTVVVDVLAGIRRSQATPPRRKAAADSYVVHAVLRAITGNTLADLQPGPEDLRVRVVHSQIDQEGRGVSIAVPDGRRLNPVRHLGAWLARAGIS